MEENRLVSRLLGGDDIATVVRLGSMVVAYVGLELALRQASQLSDSALFGSVLFLGAIAGNWLPVGVVAAALVGLGLQGRWPLLTRWVDLDHGRALRTFVVPVVIVVTWYGSTYDYNYWLDRWHSADRLLLIVLAAASVARPILLIPFAFQARVLADQFASPLGAEAGQNITDLGLMALLAVAAVVTVVIATGENDTSPALLLVSAVIAAHFFLPGRFKTTIDWVTINEAPGNFALSSYTAGFRGSGDGTWGETMASALNRLRWPIAVGTNLIELGAVLAVVRTSLLRVFLPAWILFHAVIFATSGFWLIEWVVVELSLMLLIITAGRTDWLRQNQRPIRVIAGVLLVVGAGPLLHDPPRLAWIDAPVAYGYEIEAVGRSGATYHVPLNAFAPLQQDLGFLFAVFRTDRLAVSGYGAATPMHLERLSALSTVEELREFESTLAEVDPGRIERSETLLLQWLANNNDGPAEPWFLIEPPSRFWESRPAPLYDGSEPLVEVSVVLVTDLHKSDVQTDRTTLTTAAVGDDGIPLITYRSGT